MKRTTISDVAKHAGVGKVTVSYVLNGQSRTARISHETEQRVLLAAKELSYRPNGLARMLVTKRTNTIGVVFQYAELFSSGSGFINEVMRGVCTASVEEGLDLMLHTKVVGNSETEADALSDGRVDGALALRDRDDATVESLYARGLPTVLFFTRSDNKDAAFVDADNFAGGEMATRHLIELGHKRIGFVAGPEGSVAAGDRRLGYEAAMRAAGLPVDPSLVVRCGNPEEGRVRIPTFLSRSDRPTAVFVWSDDVAATCIDAAFALGLSVPSDLSVVGFDSLEICNRTHPPLTSVRQPIFEMASEATHLLARLVRKEEVTHKQIVYSLSLDQRGSTAALQSIR